MYDDDHDHESLTAREKRDAATGLLSEAAAHLRAAGEFTAARRLERAIALADSVSIERVTIEEEVMAA
jgi:hypothetical protein